MHCAQIFPSSARSSWRWLCPKANPLRAEKSPVRSSDQQLLMLLMLSATASYWSLKPMEWLKFFPKILGYNPWSNSPLQKKTTWFQNIRPTYVSSPTTGFPWISLPKNYSLPAASQRCHLTQGLSHRSRVSQDAVDQRKTWHESSWGPTKDVCKPWENIYFQWEKIASTWFHMISSS